MDDATRRASSDMPPFETLRHLAQAREVTIGVDRSAANTFLAHRSPLHAILNWIPLGLILFSVYAFIFRTWKLGVLTLVAGVLSAPIIRSRSYMRVRMMLLGDELLFQGFYEAGWATIRLNPGGRTVRFPDDWRTELAAYKPESAGGLTTP